MTATDLETISREFINFGGIMDICPYLLLVWLVLSAFGRVSARVVILLFERFSC